LASSYTYVPYKDTGYFSHLVTDYLAGAAEILPFYKYPPTTEGLAAVITERQKYPVNRKVLVEVLEKQYAGITPSKKTAENIQSLLSEHTFTICTAHQPNLLTGYLYFVYKILHAIKLAEQLNEQYPKKHFVPVYYMGSEDNDIDELGTFRFRGNKHVWDGDGQAGAVGRMSTKGLKKLLNKLLKDFGPPGKNCDDLLAMLITAYEGHPTIATATQYLVNELFGEYGLIVLDPDDAALKAQFIPVMEDELLQQASFPIISAQTEKLAVHYKVQAHPRPLNLFYLHDQLRERIEKNGDRWVAVNTNIQWSQQEIIKELNEHPERFSPNVMLRGLFQETILPNVAFIGGGAEVAYWLQLKTLFEHYHVFYPCTLLRQSVLWVDAQRVKLRGQLEFSVAEIFRQEQELITDYVSKHSSGEWKLGAETKIIEDAFAEIKHRATHLDRTLEKSANTTLGKITYHLLALEKKMFRAEKKKMDVHVQRIHRLKNTLFPNGSLQERTDNFMEYYLEHGPEFFEIIKDGIKPIEGKFLVIE
jgi:bacillithiol biosynthesis cysteine-adding enzyme BshC